MLYEHGQKRPSAEVQADPGTDGELFVQDGWASVVVAGKDRQELRPNMYNLLRTLHDVQIVKLKLDDFLLAGHEMSGDSLEKPRQAWWCRPG